MSTHSSYGTLDNLNTLLNCVDLFNKETWGTEHVAPTVNYQRVDPTLLNAVGLLMATILYQGGAVDSYAGATPYDIQASCPDDLVAKLQSMFNTYMGHLG